MSIFADTSFFLALLNPTDDYHQAAVEFAKDQHQRLVITNAILLELGNALSKKNRRPIFLRMLELIQQRGVELVIVDEELQDRGLELFRKRMDQDWSLIDCISFVVMNDRGIAEAATTDAHFEQAGFTTLLKSK